MMAQQHANLGVAGFIVGAVTVASATHTVINPIQLATLTVVAGAFALMPDLDEPGSTVSRKFGPLSRIFSSFVKVIAFGHRGATHSLLFALLCGFLGYLASHNVFATAAIIILSMSLIAGLILPFGTGKVFYGFLMAISAALAFFSVGLYPLPSWGLPVAMFSGIVLHCLGDSLTPSGVNFLWPLGVKFRIPLNGATNGTRERLITRPLLYVASLGAIAYFILIPLSESAETNVAGIF